MLGEPDGHGIAKSLSRPFRRYLFFRLPLPLKPSSHLSRSIKTAACDRDGSRREALHSPAAPCLGADVNQGGVVVGVAKKPELANERNVRKAIKPTGLEIRWGTRRRHAGRQKLARILGAARQWRLTRHFLEQHPVDPGTLALDSQEARGMNRDDPVCCRACSEHFLVQPKSKIFYGWLFCFWINADQVD